MNTSELRKLTDEVVSIVKDAGEIVLEIYSKDHKNIQKKSDSSPLTEADTLANNFIISKLNSLELKFPIISEETTLPPFSTRSKWKYYWLIDPLDGTKEFINKNGEFTINVSLVSGDKSIIGVVFAPVFDTLYFSSLGNGAYKKKFLGNQETKIKVKSFERSSFVIANSRSHKNDDFNRFVSLFEKNNDINVIIKPMGSSLKICEVADGLVDMYPRLGPTSEWDIAAANCVLAEAGGYILDLSTNQFLKYNTKESIINSSFVATYVDQKWYTKN